MKVYVLLACESSLGKPRVIYAGCNAEECSFYYNDMVKAHFGHIDIQVWIDGLPSDEEDAEFMKYVD